MTSLDIIAKIYKSRNFFNEKLHDKETFCLRYILQSNSERFIKVSMREINLDMGENYYTRFLMWFNSKNHGIIQLWNEEPDHIHTLKSIMREINSILGEEPKIIGTIEDNNYVTMQDKVLRWSMYNNLLYRSIWPSRQNPIDPLMILLETNLNELITVPPYCLTKEEVRLTWDTVVAESNQERLWDIIANNLRSTSKYKR